MFIHVHIKNFDVSLRSLERGHVIGGYRKRGYTAQTSMSHRLLNASVFLWTTQPVILLVAQDLPLSIYFSILLHR